MLYASGGGWRTGSIASVQEEDDDEMNSPHRISRAAAETWREEEPADMARLRLNELEAQVRRLQTLNHRVSQIRPSSARTEQAASRLIPEMFRGHDTHLMPSSARTEQAASRLIPEIFRGHDTHLRPSSARTEQAASRPMPETFAGQTTYLPPHTRPAARPATAQALSRAKPEVWYSRAVAVDSKTTHSYPLRGSARPMTAGAMMMTCNTMPRRVWAGNRGGSTLGGGAMLEGEEEGGGMMRGRRPEEVVTNAGMSLWSEDGSDQGSVFSGTTSRPVSGASSYATGLHSQGPETPSRPGSVAGFSGVTGRVPAAYTRPTTGAARSSSKEEAIWEGMMSAGRERSVTAPLLRGKPLEDVPSHSTLRTMGADVADDDVHQGEKKPARPVPELVAVEGMYKEEVVINKESSRSSDLSRTKSATKTMSRFKSQAFLQKYGSAKYREQFGSTQFLGNHGSEAFRRKHKIEPATIDEAVETSCNLLCGGFSRESIFRLKCFDVYKSPTWGFFFLISTIANLTYITILPDLQEEEKISFQMGPPKSVTWLDSVDIACGLVLLFECWVGIVSMGFAGHWSCWLHTSAYHKVDFITVLVSISEYVAVFGFGVQGVTMRPFRLIRVFRVLTKIRVFSGINSILVTLKQGLAQLMTVFSMLLFFMVCFAIFGMAVYQQSFSRRCVSTPQPVPICSSDATFEGACDFLAFNVESFLNKSDVDYNESTWSGGGDTVISAGYPFETYCKTYAPNSSKNLHLKYPYDPVQDLYHTCGLRNFVNHPDGYGGTVYETCVQIGNPSNGFSHFDNIAGAMAAIFQLTSGDGGNDVQWALIESEPDVVALSFVFVFLIIALNKFLLLGLFVAVVTGVFARVRGEQGSAFQSYHGLEADDDSGHGSGSLVEERRRSITTLKSSGYYSLTTNKETLATKDGKLIYGGHPSHGSEELRNLHGIPSRRGGSPRGRARRKSSLYASNMRLSAIMDDEGEGEAQAGHFREWAKIILDHRYFNYFFSLAVVVNCMAAAADQPDTTDVWRSFASWTYFSCCIAFWLELAVRYMAADSFAEFWKAPYHKFECVLCFVATVGLNTKQRLELIACVRMYRLMRYLPTLHNILISALSSVSSIVNLAVFLLIVAVCVNITGRYLFGSQMDPFTRSNFSRFPIGLLTIFQILVGDGWTDPWYSGMAAGQSVFGTFFAAIFIAGWYTFANVIVFNLFVAVIMENFAISDTLEDIGAPGMAHSARSTVRNAYQELATSGRHAQRGKYKINPTTGEIELSDPNQIVPLPKGAVPQNRRQSVLFYSQEQAKRFRENYTDKIRAKLPVSTTFLAQNETFTEDKPLMDMALMQTYLKGSATLELMATVRTVAIVEKPQRVLFLLGPQSRVRRFFEWLGKQVAFDFVVYGSIITSCIFLVITPPRPDDPESVWLVSPSILSILNALFTIIFTAEFLVRICGQGLLLTKNAYLSLGWNRMDFLVLAFAWIELSGVFPNGNILKIARLARSLRPLRLMKRNAGMKVVIDALLTTLVPVWYVFIFAAVTLVVFSLIGQGVFGDKLARCIDSEPDKYGVMPGTEYPGGKIECSGMSVVSRGFMVPMTWVNPSFNYSTTFNAIMTLFVVNTGAYVSFMSDAMDITERFKNPVQNASIENSLFYIMYLFLGGFFVMNLFVGFIIDGFNANKGSTDSDIFYGRYIRQLVTYMPKYDYYPAPKNDFSSLLRLVLSSNQFEQFSGLCVVVNLVFMLTDHANAEEWFLNMILIQNAVFFGELVLEVVLSTVAYGPGSFYNDIWKAFDLFVATGTAFGYISGSARVGQFAKTFRILRVIRLMKMIKPIKIIMETLLICLPQLLNIIFLLFLVYSMFAVVTIEVFGVTKYGWRIGPTANFYGYGIAVLTIFQIITGDAWEAIQVDLSVVEPSCTPLFNAQYVHGWHDSVGWSKYKEEGYSFGDCGTAYAPVLCITLNLVCAQIMLNLFIGMILDNFAFITEDVDREQDIEWSTGSSPEQINVLRNIFMGHDCGTGFVSCNALHTILSEMPLPLGFKGIRYGDAERAAELLICAEVNVFVKVAREFKQERGSMHMASTWLAKRLRLADRLEFLVDLWQNTKKKDRFSCQIGFVDLMTIILCWRKPDMVPPAVMLARKQRCDEVLVMAQALVLKGFFSRLVGVRNMQKGGHRSNDSRGFGSGDFSREYASRTVSGADSRAASGHASTASAASGHASTASPAQGTMSVIKGSSFSSLRGRDAGMTERRGSSSSLNSITSKQKRRGAVSKESSSSASTLGMESPKKGRRVSVRGDGTGSPGKDVSKSKKERSEPRRKGRPGSSPGKDASKMERRGSVSKESLSLGTVSREFSTVSQGKDASKKERTR